MTSFMRPARIGKGQKKTLQTLHEGFGRKFAANLAGMLRTNVEAKLTSVDEASYSEFIFCLDNPTCINLLQTTPLEGNVFLEINPSILSMIQRLLYGTLRTTPFTDVELCLASHVTTPFLQELKCAWKNVVELDFNVVRVEINPQLIQVIPPNEVVVVFTFEVTLIEVSGIINLCIPCNLLEQILSPVL